MTTPETNARIRNTSLGYEDHGILTAMIHLEGDGWGQGFGGWALDGKPDPSNPKAGRVPTEETGRWVAGILKALEVESWEKLPGTMVRIRREGNAGWNGTIVAIGHIYKDKWFTGAVS